MILCLVRVEHWQKHSICGLYECPQHLKIEMRTRTSGTYRVHLPCFFVYPKPLTAFCHRISAQAARVGL